MTAIETFEVPPVTHPVAESRGRKTLWTAQRGERGGPPLAFILAGYGDAWVATGLAAALGNDQTVFALQPPDFDQPMKARELAAIYIIHLRAVQPHGPYCLSGYSAGAAMALEMAIQLREQGEEVGLLALLDPVFMRYTRFEHTMYLALQKLCNLAGRMLFYKPRLLQILFAMFQDHGLDRHLAALSGHRTKRYFGEAIFYQARWSMGHTPLLLTQWKWFTRATLRLVKVPGDHHTFIRGPHVKGLAQRLRAELEKVTPALRTLRYSSGE